MQFVAMVAQCNCGGKRLTLSNHSKARFVKYSISCNNCHVNSGLQNTLSDCVSVWNVAMGPLAVETEVSWRIEKNWKIGSLSDVRCEVFDG